MGGKKRSYTYLIEAPNTRENYTILELLHVISVTLHDCRVTGGVVDAIIIGLKLHNTLWKILQFDSRFRLCASLLLDHWDQRRRTMDTRANWRVWRVWRMVTDRSMHAAAMG
jgi:hypothetical protein